VRSTPWRRSRSTYWRTHWATSPTCDTQQISTIWSCTDIICITLQYTPAAEPFPLLADPLGYDPNTLDMHASVACPVNQYAEEKELDYWLAVRPQIMC